MTDYSRVNDQSIPFRSRSELISGILESSDESSFLHINKSNQKLVLSRFEKDKPLLSFETEKENSESLNLSELQANVSPESLHKQSSPKDESINQKSKLEISELFEASFNFDNGETIQSTSITQVSSIRNKIPFSEVSPKQNETNKTSRSAIKTKQNSSFEFHLFIR